MSDKPLFIIKKNLQKTAQTGLDFKSQLKDSYLEEICLKLTGKRDYDCYYVDNDYEDEFLDASYNKGRLATLRYGKYVHFITFSENNIRGRNSSIQSVPTAFNIYYMCQYDLKTMNYYFINETGNAYTDYHLFFYRLMKTVGFNLLNSKIDINSFSTIEDMMRARDANRSLNRSNNSTYISKNENSIYEAYCKTYGASKYESSMISYAMSKIIGDRQKIKLYQIIEGNLKELPQSSIEVLNQMGNVELITTDLIFEKNALLSSVGNQLRSPKYQYNLLDRLGEKKCALCDCNIPDIIQGAHVWPVASIKETNSLSIEDKVKHATNGNNGLWLCENHHKLFDKNIISLDINGRVMYYSNLDSEYIPYVNEFTLEKRLSDRYLNNEFTNYLELRNNSIDLEAYIPL